MDLIYGFGLGMVVGSGITFLVNVVFSPSEPKKKGRQGYMTLDQYLILNNIDKSPKGGISLWDLRYDNYDPEVIEARLFPKGEIVGKNLQIKDKTDDA